MQKGTIARIMDKGYGFIKVEGKEDDLFFHSNDVTGAQFDGLSEGDEVMFEETTSPKGPQASNVQPATAEADSDETADEEPEEGSETEEDAA